MSTESKRVRLIVDAIARHPAVPGAGVRAAVGAADLDDCAVVPIDADQDLVVGSDFVRGEGFALFRAGLLSRRDIGAYVVGANASDLAAMGASPLGMTLIYRYSDLTTDEQFEEVVDGVAATCQRLGMPLLGGDTGSYEVPVLGATAFGLCPRGRALLRTGGVAGDALYLTGDVGRAGAAFRYFPARSTARGSLPEPVEIELLEPWRSIEPALLQGQLLISGGFSHCAIDTSDGLFAAAELLATASRVDAVLDIGAIPVRDSVKLAAEYLETDWVGLAGGVSVDFRLLFSSPPQVERSLVDAFDSRGWRLYKIGRLLAPSARAAVYLEEAGRRVRKLHDCW